MVKNCRDPKFKTTHFVFSDERRYPLPQPDLFGEVDFVEGQMDDSETVPRVPDDDGPFAAVEDGQFEGGIGQLSLGDVENEFFVELRVRRSPFDLRVELASSVRQETDPTVGIDRRTASGQRRGRIQILRADYADGQQRQFGLVADGKIDGAAVLLLNAAKLLLLADQRLKKLNNEWQKSTQHSDRQTDVHSLRRPAQLIILSALIARSIIRDYLSQGSFLIGI